MNLPAALHVCALLIALCVQTMGSPLAGSWLLFHLGACACMLQPCEDKGLVWWACLSWLLALGIGAFILRPVVNGAATLWVLAAMPTLALSARREHLRGYVIGFLAVLTLYALGLIAQMLLHVRYTAFEYFIPETQLFASSWPLLDPNNAAAVMNMGLIPCFYMTLRKPRWSILLAIFTFALFATASKAGAAAALIACAVLAFERYNAKCATSGLSFVGCILAAILTPLYGSSLVALGQEALKYRFAIWHASAPLLHLSPWRGLGLGSFGSYYALVRTEQNTGGWFAHNDLLQFAIEAGIPAAAVFCCLILAVIATTRRSNIVSACTMLAVFLQSMVEFQFYVPAVSILMGLALAHHRLNGAFLHTLSPSKARSAN